MMSNSALPKTNTRAFSLTVTVATRGPPKDEGDLCEEVSVTARRHVTAVHLDLDRAGLDDEELVTRFSLTMRTRPVGTSVPRISPATASISLVEPVEGWDVGEGSDPRILRSHKTTITSWTRPSWAKHSRGRKHDECDAKKLDRGEVLISDHRAGEGGGGGLERHEQVPSDCSASRRRRRPLVSESRRGDRPRAACARTPARATRRGFEGVQGCSRASDG